MNQKESNDTGEDRVSCNEFAVDEVLVSLHSVLLEMKPEGCENHDRRNRIDEVGRKSVQLVLHVDVPLCS